MKTIKTQTMNKTGTNDSDLRTLKKKHAFQSPNTKCWVNDQGP